MRLRLADVNGKEKELVGIFYAMDMNKPAIILGCLWRRRQAILMDSVTDQWRYGCAPEGVRVREPRDFLKDLKREQRIFAVTLTRDVLAEESQLLKEFRPKARVFEYKDIASLKRPKGVDYAINLEPRKRPLFQPLYNLSERELTALRKYLKTAEENG